MSEPKRHAAWQPWQMGPLDRRARPILDPSIDDDTPGEINALPRRRWMDAVAQTVLDRARADADTRGYAEGYERGLAEGQIAGQNAAKAEHEAQLEREITSRLAPVERFIEQFELARAALDTRVALQLAELAIEAGRQLAGRALELAPEHIVDDVQELLENYPALSGTPTLYVSADDLAYIEHHLSQSLATAGWRLRADSRLAAGDCRLEDEEREIISGQADRWSRLLHAVGHEEH